METDNRIFTPEGLKDLDVALVHYWFMTWRGGEKVVQSLLQMFPKADIYTLFFDPAVCGPYLKNRKVTSSCLDLPGIRKHYQKLFPLYPRGIKSLRLHKQYDLIISSESGPAKAIPNPDRIPHLCYVHTPMRYCWGYTDLYLASLPKWLRKMAAQQFQKLKEWDSGTVDAVDLYVSNSNNVAQRVKQYYGKESRTCYPPIALDLFANPISRKPGEFFLSFGALTPYKNIQLLVETFNTLGERLVIIGEGSEKTKLMKLAGRNIEFLGGLPTKDVLDYIQRAKALLFPGEEDFGMIPLEVMSQGVPVIAYKKGGALETVVENEQNRSRSSGLFFNEATIEQLTAAVKRFSEIEAEFDPSWIKAHARRFGEDRFQDEMKGHILDVLNNRY